MDVRKTAREIGLFETAINLAQVEDSEDVIQKVGACLPLPDRGVGEATSRIAQWLLGFHKGKYMLLTPEIALAEEMARQAGGRELELIFAVPCDMDPEAKERLEHNLPREIPVTILEEPYFPEGFYPGNGMMVICGYSGGGRPMVLPDTYRMANHYQGFLGKKVFVPYVELETASRYEGWMELGRQQFRGEWRGEEWTM